MHQNESSRELDVLEAEFISGPGGWFVGPGYEYVRVMSNDRSPPGWRVGYKNSKRNKQEEQRWCVATVKRWPLVLFAV